MVAFLRLPTYYKQWISTKLQHYTPNMSINRLLGLACLAMLSSLTQSFAHDLSEYQHPHSSAIMQGAKKAHHTSDLGEEAASSFNAFAPHVRTKSDDDFLYVESDSMPHHPMMVGITAWQQQVPIPQPYTGNNAWRIPLKPVPAKEPMSAKDHFFRGAIALAANGVPIFNPIKNDGKTDTFLAGELDDYGGHSGRGDDYHYHIPPLHLQTVLGESLPVAYALDGYPIYGLDEPDGTKVGKLDKWNGHIGPKGDYHYHSTKKYPYLNGGFYGEVVERGGQVDPQPRAQGVRPYTRPLRGAKITGWEQDENRYSVEYQIGRDKGHVNYTLLDEGKVRFEFIDTKGNTTTETYEPRDNRQGGGGNREARPQERDRNREGRQRGGGGSGGRGRNQDRASNDQRPQPSGQRVPWILAHAVELDTNQDEYVSRTELEAEIAKTLATIDGNKDDRITRTEAESQRGGLPMGGFVKQHYDELDKNSDEHISGEELSSSFLRMFDRADDDGDKKIGPVDPTLSVKRERPQRNGSNDQAATRENGRATERSDTSTSKAQNNIASSYAASINPKTNPSQTISSKTVPPEQPNFIVILIDDMGWKDMGFSGSDFIDTPHTDALAKQGVIFSQAYSSAPNCAPTRACLMSGQYTPRHGVYTVVDARHAPGSAHHKILAADSSAELASESVTIAESFKAGGYATAMYGMWNLGRGRNGPVTPTGQGFDDFKQPRDLGFEKDAYINDRGEYLTDAFTSEGIRFMEDNKTEPFFLYLAYHAVHHPFEPKPELLQKYEKKARSNNDKRNIEYAATVEAMDQNIGRLEAALQKLGLKDNTIVVFTSDNGGNRQNVAPLSGSKGSLYEGGTRVPAAIWGPGIRKSYTSDSFFLSMDIYPTLLELAGLPQPKNHILDGISFASMLLGASEPDRDTIFFHFPSYIGAGGPSSAIRKGDYKLIEQFESGTVELYDLSKDVGESKNLAKSQPELTQKLYAELLGWHESTGAPRPTQLNPNYDPQARPIRGRENRGKGGGGGGNRTDRNDRGDRDDRGDRQNRGNRQNQRR